MATRKRSAAVETKVEQTESKFSKEQIVASAKYAGRRDLVDALLMDGKMYTMIEVGQLVSDYMKGQVK